MASLTAQLFRDYFNGSWIGNVSKNQEFQRQISFNWPVTSGRFSAVGVEAGIVVPSFLGILNDTKQVAIAGWRSDL